MTYVVTKYIKGNPYLYEVKSVREGDRVRQVFVRYLGRADKPSREYSETEPVERRERIRRPAVAAVAEAVTPTVKASNEIATVSGRRLVAPKIRVTSDILAKRDSLKADEWLLNEAKKELEPKLVITGRIPLPGSPEDKAEFQMGLLKGINPKKMTQADKDTAWEILTGEPNAPSVFELVETKPIVKPTPEVEVPAPKIAPEQQQVFYHGSDAIFDIKDFKAETKGTTSTTFGQVEVDRHGIFLSESPEFASEYGKKVTPIKTNIKNTADIQVGDNPSNAVQGFIDSLDPFGSDRDLWLLAKNTRQEWGLFDGELGARFTKYLKEQGFDSARFEEYLPAESTKVGHELQGHTLVVLDPNVISTPDPEVVAPTVAVETETPALVERTGQEMRAIRDRLQGERMGWQVPQAEFINIESEVSGSPITPDFSESMVDTHKSLIQRAIREGEDVPAEVLKDYPKLSPEATPIAVETVPVTKEPWQMTKAERATYIEQKGKESIQKWNESGGKGFPPSNPERWGVSEVNKAADELGMPWGEGRVAIPQHKYEVMVALKQGKPIPPEVLKDYPDLAPKPTPEIMVTPGSLGQKHGIEVEVVKGQEGGEWAGGIARVGDDTNLMNYRAGDWTSTKADDFVSQKQYPGNVVSAAHEIAHGLFTQNPEKAHRALQELQKLGVPENVAFESLVDLGGLYLLEPSSIANTELRSVVETWLEKKPTPPVEEEPAVAPTAPVTPENKPGERKFIGITRETDPTQKRAPWRVAYERAGKEYAHHLSSQNQAIQYAKERLGVAVDPKTLKPVTPTAPAGEPVPEIAPITPTNPYMNMPIERVRRDAEHGVKLAKEALAVREAVTPEVTPVTTKVAMKLNPDQLLTADARKMQGQIELALTAGSINPRGIRFNVSSKHKYPQAVGNEVLIPSSLMDEIDLFLGNIAHEAKHAEMTISKRTIDMTADEIEEVAEQARILAQRVIPKAEVKPEAKTVTEPLLIEPTISEPIVKEPEIKEPTAPVTPEVIGLLKWYKEPGGAWQADAIDNIKGKEQVIEVYKDTETGEWKWIVSDRQRNYLRSGISQSEEEAKSTAMDMWYKQPPVQEAGMPEAEVVTPTAPAEEPIVEAEKVTIYHAKTKGEFPTGKPSTDIGSDADILGKGFYFGTKEYASRYGTPEAYTISGKFATQEQWVEALAQYGDSPIKEQRALARESLQNEGYVGIRTKEVGVVWDDKAIQTLAKPEEVTPIPPQVTTKEGSLIAKYTETKMSPETGLDTEYSTEYRLIGAPENAGAEWMGNEYGIIRVYSKGGVKINRDLLEVGMSEDAVVKALPWETSYKKAEKYGLAKTEYEKYERGILEKEQAKEASEQAEKAGYERYLEAIKDLGSIKGIKKTNITYFSPVDNEQKTREGFDVGNGVGIVVHEMGKGKEYAVTHINTGLAMGHNWKNRAEAIALAKSVAGITDWSKYSNEKEIPQEIMSEAASLVRGFTQKSLQLSPIDVTKPEKPTPEIEKPYKPPEILSYGLPIKRAIELGEDPQYPRMAAAVFHFDELTPDEQNAVIAGKKQELADALQERKVIYQGAKDFGKSNKEMGIKPDLNPYPGRKKDNAATIERLQRQIQMFEEKLEPVIPKTEEPQKQEAETTPSIRELQYSRDLDIRNIEALPKGTGAKYLITLKGQGEELIAKQWARVKPKSLKPDEVLVSMTPTGAEKIEPTTTKKPWQMTKSEYGLAENEPRVEAIKQAITQGKPIVLATHTKAVKIANPEHIRITSTGEVQIPQGRKWIYLTDDQIVNLAKQAGIEPVPFEEKVYHHAEVKQALSEGKKVSDDILKDYPDLKREAKTFPRIKEMVSGLKVRDDIPNMSSIESSLEDYEILEGIREIPTVDEGEITPPKFYSVEQEKQTKELAEQIKASGEITPLILVTEGDKDYILEGSHRYDALRLLGIKSFPALVVKNLRATPSESEE